MRKNTKFISKHFLFVLILLLGLSTSGCTDAKDCFKVVGAMSTPRAHHAATLLQDGRVLITGGTSGLNEFNTAEIFDPKTNKFHRISNMNEKHAWHSATLLKDGRVLIIDTRSYLKPKKGVEIFDPKTEKFSYIHTTNYPQDHSIAILLDNGEVVVFSANRHIEIFNPKTNTFRVAGEFKDYFCGYYAIKMPDENIAMFGGTITPYYDPNSYTRRPNYYQNKDVLLYDPKTEKIENIGETNTPKSHLNALLLNNNKVLLIGGHNHSEQKVVELYDIKTNKSEKINDTNFYYMNHSLTLLPNGKVLLTNGYMDKLLNKAEIFDPKTNLFKIKKMHFNRGNSTATLLKDGRVLITGGEPYGPAPKKAEIYDYRNDK